VGGVVGWEEERRVDEEGGRARRNPGARGRGGGRGEGSDGRAGGQAGRQAAEGRQEAGRGQTNGRTDGRCSELSQGLRVPPPRVQLQLSRASRELRRER